jgi:hypothetical protein
VTQEVAFNPLTDSAVRKNTVDADTDDDVPLNFQERSLREFFRQPGSMKMEPHTAQLKMFLTCIDVLCGSDNDTEPKKSLQVYAVTGWLKHLSDLDAEAAASPEVVLVVEALARFLANTNNVASVIERTDPPSSLMYDALGPLSDQLKNKHRLNLVKWANTATLQQKSIFSSQAWAWANSLASGHTDVTLDLTRGHLLNWFKTTDVASAQKAFGAAWDAMKTVSNSLELTLFLSTPSRPVLRSFITTG